MGEEKLAGLRAIIDRTEGSDASEAHGRESCAVDAAVTTSRAAPPCSGTYVQAPAPTRVAVVFSKADEHGSWRELLAHDVEFRSSLGSTLKWYSAHCDRVRSLVVTLDGLNGSETAQEVPEFLREVAAIAHEREVRGPTVIVDVVRCDVESAIPLLDCAASVGVRLQCVDGSDRSGAGIALSRNTGSEGDEGYGAAFHALSRTVGASTVSDAHAFSAGEHALLRALLDVHPCPKRV